MRVKTKERDYELRRYRHTADELLIRLYFGALVGIIVCYCSPSYYIVKLSQFLREVRFLRGTYEKIVSSAADRPKLVVRGHALTENV